jgi:hypothetical protein
MLALPFLFDALLCTYTAILSAMFPFVFLLGVFQLFGHTMQAPSFPHCLLDTIKRQTPASLADLIRKARHNLVSFSLVIPRKVTVRFTYSPTLPFRCLLLLFWFIESEGGRIGRRVVYGYPASWMILSEVMLLPYAVSCREWKGVSRTGSRRLASPTRTPTGKQAWMVTVSFGLSPSSTPCLAADRAAHLALHPTIMSTVPPKEQASSGRSTSKEECASSGATILQPDNDLPSHLDERPSCWQHSTQCNSAGSTCPRSMRSGRSRDYAETHRKPSYVQRTLQRLLQLQCYFTCWQPTILSTRAAEAQSSFSLVADTGSSFSLTPYESDLIHVIASGPLGEVSTVEERKMPLTKLGYAEYFVPTTDGREVPIYPIVFVIPRTQQRLLSPQDYYETLKLPATDDVYGGTNKYFWFKLNASGDVAGTHLDPVSNLPHFRVRLRNSSDPPRQFVPTHTHALQRESFRENFPCECHLAGNTCDCSLSPFKIPLPPVSGNVNAITAYDEANEQLTPAQRFLLLWHHRLGHRGFQHVQKLFNACDTAKGTPFNTTDCAPCLPTPSGISKQSVSQCKPPLCLCCEIGDRHAVSSSVSAPNTRHPWLSSVTSTPVP